MKQMRLLAASLIRTLALVWRSDPRLALMQALLAVALALLPFGALYALKRAVDAAAGLARLAGTAGPTDKGVWAALSADPSVQAVAGWFLAGAVAMGALAGLRAWMAWVAEQHAMAVSDYVHARLHAKMLTVDLAFFENTSDQNRLHLAQAQAMTRPVAALDSLFQALYALVGLLGVLALLAALHPLAALWLAGVGVPLLLLRIARSKRLYAWRRDLAPLEREAGYYHHLLVGGEYAKELRMQGQGPFFRERFEGARNRLRLQRLAWRRYVLGWELALQLALLAAVALLLVWMVGRLLGGALTLGALVMYAQAVQRGQGQLGTLAGALADLHQSALFLQAFEELMALPARVRAPAVPRAPSRPLREGLVFDHVDFAYPGAGRPVLRDVSFTLRPGERLVLAGANGAGKSTVIKLLCRLYDPDAGRILADGIDLREMDPIDWRRRVGSLFQDFGRYQLTAGENIWIGDPLGPLDDPRVSRAAQRAGLDEMIRKWPGGLAAPLGRWLREGTEPSAGQWQRIAVARTLVKEADLLVMDEPASALDAQAQRELLAQLRCVLQGRLCVVASHQPEVLAWADRVIVLREGRVAGTGTPASLLAAGGEYASLFADPAGRPRP